MTESNQAIPAEQSPAQPKEAAKQPTTTKEKPRQTQAKSKKALFAIIISLLTLILVACVLFFFWQKLDQQTMLLEQKISHSQQEAKALKPSLDLLQHQVKGLNDLQLQHQALLKTLAEDSYFHSQKLTDLGARSRNDWLLAEAEYLMRLANQRLHLEQDIASAEAMLTSADKIVSEINDPGLVEIRKTLASEVVSLQQIKHLDYQGLFLKLNAIINSLDKIKPSSLITQREENIPSDSTASSESTNNLLIQIWSSIWQDLKQAVVIRRLDQPVEPLLAPEQEYYLTQNLRLILEQASLALIDQNTGMFQTSLTKALNWLDRYFSSDDPQIASIVSSLTSMSTFEIDRELPDISGSLRLMKAKIESFYKQHNLSKLSTPDQEINAKKQEELEKTSNDDSSQGAAL